MMMIAIRPVHACAEILYAIILMTKERCIGFTLAYAPSYTLTQSYVQLLHLQQATAEWSELISSVGVIVQS